MSEEARLAYLREEIRKTKRNERFGKITTGLGIIALILGILGIANEHSLGIPSMILGAILSAIGTTFIQHSLYQYKELTIQLEKVALTTITCPKCGKEIPKQNFMFCPFCGASLENKPKS